MKDSWLEKWNDRYRQDEYAFGIDPNDYLKAQLEKLNPGSILFPGEGEGRNAVYAARLGWHVHAFDISEEGKIKALRLAETNNVTIDYRIDELPELNYGAEQFDVIALIYAHFPADIKSMYHRLLSNYLRKGGTIIFEAFSKKHIDYVTRNPNVGGPKDLPSLFSIEEIRSDFENYEITELVEEEIELNEGMYHKGKGSVIRFVGLKK